MPRAAAAVVLVFLCTLCCTPTAEAGRRISADPTIADTTRAFAAVPAAKLATARLPIWVTFDEEFAVTRTTWSDFERDGRRLRETLSLYLPAARPNWRSWIAVGYEQDQLLVPVTIMTYVDSSFGYVGAPTHLRVPTSYFELFVGVDRTHGAEDRPWGFTGAGVGFGYGQYAAPWRSDAFAWSGFEATARAGLYFYPWQFARLGVRASGLAGWRRASEAESGALGELRLGLSIESPLELPKRFVTGS